MVTRILDTRDDAGLVGLTRLGQFLDAFIRGLCRGRQCLIVARLPGAIRLDLARVASRRVLKLILAWSVISHRQLASFSSLIADTGAAMSR